MPGESYFSEPLIHETTERLAVYGACLMRVQEGESNHVTTVSTLTPGKDVVVPLFRETVHVGEVVLYAALRKIIISDRDHYLRLGEQDLRVANFMEEAEEIESRSRGFQDETMSKFRAAATADRKKLAFPYLETPDDSKLLVANYAGRLLWKTHLETPK